MTLSINPPFPTFQDVDGKPLENGYIWIGAENLDPQSNPIAVFWDAALTQAAAQPIRTNGGYPVNAGTPARIYTSTPYSIRVMDKKGRIVYSSPSETLYLDASRVQFLQSGAGAIPRTVQDKLREFVSVVDYDNVNGGVVDATVAFTEALAEIPEWGELDLRGQIYAVSGVVVTKNNVTVKNGRLVALPSASIAVIKAAPGTSGVRFENLNVYINRPIITAPDCAGIFFDQCTNGKAINCHVDGSKNDNYGPQLYSGIYGYQASKIDVQGCSVINAHREGIMFAESDDIYIYDSEGRNSGFSNIGTSGGNRAIINACRAFNSGATNITMNSQDSIVSNCLTSGNALNNGILIGHATPASQNANNCLVSNNRVLNSAEYGVAVVYGTNVVVEGNTITGCTKASVYVIPKPSTNGGTTIANNVMDGCEHGIYYYGSPESQTIITGNTIRSSTSWAVVVASNGQVNIANNILRNVNAGVLALGHVTGATLTGAGITNLSISNNIFRGVTFGSINVKHLLQAAVIGNTFEATNASGTAGVDLFTLENSNGGTASQMPSSVVFQSNTTRGTNAASKLLDAQTNILNATVTRFNLQNNDLQDFSPSNIFTGAGFGTTATYSAVGNQVGTDARAPQISIVGGTTSTIITNSNLLGRDVGPVIVANEAVFNTLNVRITNYAFGSITLNHSAPGATISASMTMA